MEHQTKTQTVTVEEIPPSSTDHLPYQVTAFTTPQGMVVVIREWPTVKADE